MIRENVPRRDEPEDTRFWCEEHECYMFQDYHGQSVCIVCMIEDRIFNRGIEVLLDDDEKTVYFNMDQNRTVINWKDSDVIEIFPGRMEVD